MPAKVNGKALPVRTAFPDPSETALSTPSNSSALTTGPAASIFSAPASKIQTVLFEIVSRLTGFPEEMLEPDMDIESDLGVDSIKKVEIISELEKHLPDTQGLTPENIGTARTLNDICHAIAAKSQEMPTYQRPTPALHPDSDKPAPARRPTEETNRIQAFQMP